MYRAVGKLAKSLSSSLQDISLEDLKRVDLPITGEQIGDARQDLESVVKMTETATLNIMDLVDTIQQDCQTVQKNVEAIEDLPALKPSQYRDLLEQLTAQVRSLEEARNELHRMREEKGTALAELEQQPAPDGSDTSQAIGVVPLDGLLQTLYEFCTSEDHKAKIRLMREKQDGLFDVAKLQDRLGQTAPELEQEDGFYSFPVTLLLKHLQETCGNPKVESYIASFLDDADTLFPDSTLPLEMTRSAADHEPQPQESTACAPTSDTAAALLRDDLRRLDAILARFDQGKTWEAILSRMQEFSVVQNEDETTPMEVLGHSRQAIARIGTALTRITEALSFQDLSGQQILKIIELLKGVQMQLLSIMVAHHTRIRERNKQPEISVNEQEKLVQSEVDRMISDLTVSETPEQEGSEKLDQDKVNELLDSMGF
jgi:chemotaxis regulatin CheY-phosphate phosphatase CheZ